MELSAARGHFFVLALCRGRRGGGTGWKAGRAEQNRAEQGRQKGRQNQLERGTGRQADR